MTKPFSRKKIEEKMKEYPLENIYTYKCDTTTKISDIDNNVYYSEVMSEYILRKAEIIQKIQKNNAWKIEPSKGLSYFTPYRNNITQAILEEDGKHHFEEDDEKIICRELYIRSKNGTKCEGLGKIVDFETPLARLREVDKEPYKYRIAGKVDLISCNLEEEPTIWLLEVKNKTNNESMYRCVMEGFTYLQTIDRDRFIADLKKRYSQFETINETIRFRTAPLIVYKGNQYKEMEEAKKVPSSHKKLLELMRFLDIKVYFSYQIESNEFIFRKHFI